MKIDSKVLTRFVKKATLGGSIPSFIFRFGATGLNIQCRETTNIAAAMGFLEGKNIKGNEELELPIKSSSRLLGMIGSFDGEIEIKKNANILSIFDKDKQVDIVLCGKEFVTNDLETALKIDYGSGVTIDSGILKKAVKDMSILGSKEIAIEFKDKKMNITVGEKDFDQIIEKSDADYGNCRSVFGEMMANVIDVIGDKVKISMKDDHPIIIEETLEDGGSVKYMVAPLVDNEADDK